MPTPLAPPLSWVKPEVDFALKSVRDNIAQFLARPEEVALLEQCPQRLHQVTGALNILGLSGVVGVCESMERAFSGVSAEPRKSAVGTLDRAVLALKEFIDGLAKGEANAPIKLYPVYREVSSLHGRQDVSEKDLFFPDLSPAAPAHPAAATVPLQKLPATLTGQRSRFQRGLLSVLRDPTNREGLKDMRQALETLDMIAAQLPPPRSLWWAATGLIDGLLHADPKDSWAAAAKALCAKLDLRMRDLAKGSIPEQDQILRDVLFAIGKSKVATTRTRDIRQLYQLDSLFPEPDLPGLMEFDLDWLGPALSDVRTRVQAVKDLWVAYVSGDTSALPRLRDSLTALKDKIHDLGNIQMIRMVDVVAMVSTRLPNPYPRQSQLMITEMASAFLLIENIVENFTDTPPDLGTQVEIMGGWLLDAVKGKSGGTIPEGLREDLSQEVSRLKLQTQVAREIHSNLQQVEQVLDSYARDRSRVSTLPTLSPLLKQIHGALSILGFDRAAEVQSQCNRLVTRCAQSDPAWTENDLETVVEGLTSLGFFLDPCLRGLPPAEHALDVFFERLAARNAPQQQPVSKAAAQIPAVPALAPTVAAGAPLAASRPVQTSADDELLGVFLEEAQSVFTDITTALPVCRSNPAETEALITIRRGFHTLKGSGRMVGLDALGEVAWAVERVMNRWLDQHWPATPALLELIESATQALTDWTRAIPENQPVAIDGQHLIEMAAALQTAPQPAAPPLPAGNPDEVCLGNIRISRTFFDIYRKEAQQHITVLGAEIQALCDAPGRTATDALEIAAHTLASISRTAGLSSPADLAMRIEQCLPQARLLTNEADLQLLREAVAKLREMLDDIAQQQEPRLADAMITDLDALNRRLQSAPTPAQPLAAFVRETPVPAAGAVIEPVDDAALVQAAAALTAQDQRLIHDDIDAELLPMFLDEAQELLPQISRDLRAWRETPADRQIQLLLQRALHTLKGSARMAGAMRLGELAHLMESRVETVVAGGDPVSAQFEDLENHVDRLADSIESLQALDLSNVDSTAVSAENTVPAPAIARAMRPESTPQTAAALRIQADALDRLINDAGEVGIARSRIEGELRNVRQSLGELNDSMARLRNQLREMELQADSQMQSRRSVVAADRPEFDPLEFDRYTRLQELTRMMAESLHDLSTVQQTLQRNLGEIDSAVLHQARVGRELQQGLMRTRTVPFANLEGRLYRIARQTARDLDKKIQLDISDSHIELDRSVLERISAPLEHLLRNAIGHGIESPDTRRAAGKPEAGEISIALRQESNEIAIIISDDGTGLDLEKLRTRGIEKGLIDPAAELSSGEIGALIFAPGVSTASAVTELAGRGVGMDVVRSEITAIGGHIDTSTASGKGTTFSIFLPLTLAVAQAVLVRAGSGIFAISSSMVEQVIRVQPDALDSVRREGRVRHRDNDYPLHALSTLLGERAAPAAQGYSTLLLLRSGLQRIALQVDELLRNQEIVVKHLSPQLARVPGVTGATVLGDGRVVLIINPVPLTLRATPALRAVEAEPEISVVATAPTVMVVDDSLTVRKITSRLLEREGYQVLTAKDGIDALEQMKKHLPDLMLVDIEMPRMDGFELSSRVRQDSRSAGVPIVIISSRTAEKHRSRAEQIGVNAFLGKPYQEAELLAQLATYVPQRAEDEHHPVAAAA
jgi:chemosensory pili system protein ChpA (sensor histidine kinase/response regulator)